jgi:hypothetical protein
VLCHLSLLDALLFPGAANGTRSSDAGRYHPKQGERGVDGLARRYYNQIVLRWGCGAVGARFLGMEEVAGSNPASSTTLVDQQQISSRARLPAGSSGKCAPSHAMSGVSLRRLRMNLPPRGMAGAITTCLLLGLLWRLSAAQSPAPRHDLTVLVVARSSGPGQVALTYSHPCDHSRLRTGIEELASRLNARVSQVTIEDAALALGSDLVGTAAEFVVAELVRGGALPVGPIARSLPDWEHLRIAFIMDQMPIFCGPEDVTADGFIIRLVNRSGPYEYDVERMRGTAAPVAPGGAETDEPAVPEARPLSAAALPVALVAMPGGFLLGWFLLRPRRNPESRRPTQEDRQP